MLFASGCAEEQPEEEVEEPVDEVTEEEIVEEEMPVEEEIVEEEVIPEEDMAEENITEEEEEEEEMPEEDMAEENITEEEMPEENITEDEMAEEDMNIVETAAASGDFDTLVTAVQTAGLEDTLSGEGPYTVFAPTDEAFDALPEGELDDLLADEGALTNVLLYHVADGEIDITETESVETLQGDELIVDPTSDPITVGDANIIGDRIETSNGFIYPIDAVLLPPE